VPGIPPLGAKQRFEFRLHMPDRRRPGARHGYQITDSSLRTDNHRQRGFLLNGLLRLESRWLSSQANRSIWLSGFSGTRIPRGVKWGGYKQNRLLKGVRLAPAPEARGRHLDLNDIELLHVALRLERQRRMHSRRGAPRRPLRLPRLWAGFDPSNAVHITGRRPDHKPRSNRPKRASSPGLVSWLLRYHFLGWH